MTQNEFTLFGKEYKLAFDFATVCLVEEIIEKPFLATDFDFTLKNKLYLVWACFKVANPDFMQLDEFIKRIDSDSLMQSAKTCTLLMREFFHIPSNVPEEEKSRDEEDSEDTKKP